MPDDEDRETSVGMRLHLFGELCIYEGRFQLALEVVILFAELVELVTKFNWGTCEWSLKHLARFSRKAEDFSPPV